MSYIISNLNSEEIEELDMFNFRHTRDRQSQLDYNCMSYAFGCYEWLYPYDAWREEELCADEVCHETGHFDVDDEMLEDIDDCLNDGVYDHPYLLEFAVKRMLDVFCGLRQIKSFDGLGEGEYGIVYAAGGGDFHFGKYDPDTETYSHKMGSRAIEEVPTEDHIFGTRYDSERFYFAMKRSLVGEINY